MILDGADDNGMLTWQSRNCDEGKIINVKDVEFNLLTECKRTSQIANKLQAAWFKGTKITFKETWMDEARTGQWLTKLLACC